MRLYHNALSSNARRVALTAEHLHLPLELVVVDLMSPADRERLTELNPNCKIPVLEDQDFLLWESCAIMQYLADGVPGQTVYPAGRQARADVNRWMFWACQHLSAAVGTLAWENVWKGMLGMGQADPAEVERGERDAQLLGKLLDAHLATRAYLVGEALTLADFAVAAPLMYLERARLPLRQFTHLMRWLDQVQQLDAWKKTEAVW